MSRILSVAGAVLSAALVLPAPASAAAAPGARLFADNCAACHQPEGQGIAGAFPALAANSFVQGPAEAPLTVLLNGRGGMPTFRNDLSDEQIAGVLSYVRSAWGNKAGPVEPAAVAAARGVAQSENAAAALQAH
ncbi:MAG TPA: cytochrome c [Caulobacteraceae bacterium]|nr:cytochrome c [Caulobacteraceae bacterium]